MKYYKCACQQCRIRGLQAPLMLITIGLLFALDQIWNLYSFSQTWPVILIVMGLSKTFQRFASDAGHGTRRYPPMTDTGVAAKGASLDVGGQNNAS